MAGIVWMLISYFLGSVPFGFLVSRLFGGNSGIGWQKASGATSVFRNTGKWQGFLTGLLDIGKGYLCIFLAQKMGFSPATQVLSGIAVIAGHNWSPFLRFGGGRGVAAFFGAFLAFSPKLLIISVVPLIAITLIWEAATATILFLVIGVILAYYLNQFATVGLFIFFSSFLILAKRLSPFGEIKPPFNSEKLKLIRNRLVFDNNNAIPEFRIKRIFKRLKTFS